MDHDESPMIKIHSERPNHPIDDPTLNNEMTKLGVVAHTFLGHLPVETYGNDGTLKPFLDKMQQLEATWIENEKKYALLQAANEQLQMQLLSEKNKCVVLQKKLQFIQEHKGHFEKLKEVYSKMKEMELEKNRSRLNVHMGTQSESFMSVSSYATCMIQTESNDRPLGPSSSTISVRKVELAKAQDTINVLKQLIFRREQTWGFNRDKQKNYVQSLKMLVKENASLRSVIRSHYKPNKEHIGTSMEDINHISTISVALNSVQPTKSISTNTMYDNTLEVMQSTVKKLEHKNTELEKMINKKQADSSSVIFNMKEGALPNQDRDDAEQFKKISSQRFSTAVLPDLKINESTRSSTKTLSKSASNSPIQRSRIRSLPPLTRPCAPGSAPASQQYPAHSRCLDPRCQEPSCITTTAHSSSKRSVKPQCRSGKTDAHLPLVMRPGAQEEVEREILNEIKNEIWRKQQNARRKLEPFYYGLDRKEKIR